MHLRKHVTRHRCPKQQFTLSTAVRLGYGAPVSAPVLNLPPSIPVPICPHFLLDHSLQSALLKRRKTQGAAVVSALASRAEVAWSVTLGGKSGVAVVERFGAARESSCEPTGTLGFAKRTKRMVVKFHFDRAPTAFTTRYVRSMTERNWTAFSGGWNRRRAKHALADKQHRRLKRCVGQRVFGNEHSRFLPRATLRVAPIRARPESSWKHGLWLSDMPNRCAQYSSSLRDLSSESHQFFGTNHFDLHIHLRRSWQRWR